MPEMSDCHINESVVFIKLPFIDPWGRWELPSRQVFALLSPKTENRSNRNTKKTPADNWVPFIRPIKSCTQGKDQVVRPIGVSQPDDSSKQRHNVIASDPKKNPHDPRVNIFAHIESSPL